MAGAAVADVKEEERFEFKLDAGGRISLENINGNVRVTGGSGNMVEIIASKKAGKQKYLDELEIIIKATDEAIFIETDHPDSSGWLNWGNDSNGSVSYQLNVPADVVLDTIETVNGDVEISGVIGDVNAESVNGDVEATGLSADVEMETVNGSLDAVFVRFDGNQKAEFSTVNGRATASLPADASFSVNAETINGSIDTGSFGLEAEKGFVGWDLDGEVGSGSARLSLDTVNGSIRIRSH
jgi:DUF4097 and DUF4098 domain-containing protein YvlB